MEQEDIRNFVAQTFSEAQIVIASAESGAPEIAWGDTFFFHDQESAETVNRFPFATIVTKDYGDFDNASNLNRPGVFRLNIGLSREKFRSLFGASFSLSDYDFTAFDKLLPHPVYAAQFFVCILKPSEATFEKTVRPLLAEAYAIARKRSGYA